MSKFTFIEYSGKDAGAVLAGILGGGIDNSDGHDVSSDTETAFKTGFQPAEVEGDDDGNDDD